MAHNNNLLEKILGRILSPLERFLRSTAAGSVVLIGATMAALILANSPWGEPARRFWERTAVVGVGGWRLELALHAWVNDGLMTLFFLVVGLELKREILVGELSSLRDAALPVIAAAGGMIAPALIYHLFNRGGPAVHGWGVPMATDIAFSVGILVLLAWRIPRNLVIFLMALAIADDLGAVLIIAFFYTREIGLAALGAGAGILSLLIALNLGGIRHPLPYGILGALLWLALLKSGVHPTISGVLLALAIPARPMFSLKQFKRRLARLKDALGSGVTDPDACEHALKCPVMATVAEELEKTAKAVQSPLQRMEHSLSPWVSFLVIPIFALSNVGVDFSLIRLDENLWQPVAKGVFFGLVAGKFLGVMSFSWLAVKLGLARLPGGVDWRGLSGAAWLAGIGFTMSLFISQLAFAEPLLREQAKLGILIASAVSAAIGSLWLYAGSRVSIRSRGES